MTRWPSTGGGGVNWSPGLLDRAEVFDGSDGERVSREKTVVASEGIELGHTPGTTVSRHEDGSFFDRDYPSGLMVNPNTDAGGVEVTLSSDVGEVSQVFLATGDGSELLDEKEGTFTAGDTVRLSASLKAGTEYIVSVNDGGDSYVVGRSESVSYPVTSEDIDITAGVERGYPPNGDDPQTDQYAAFNIVDVTAFSEPAMSGSATIEWPMPDDVAGWDIIPYQAGEDGGTVEVYAIDPADESRLAGPLNDPGDISDIPRDTNVAVEVVLERPSTSEYPRLEAVYRRRKIT